MSWRKMISIGAALTVMAAAWLLTVSEAGAQNDANYSLRFYGHGVNDIDRVKIPLDDPANGNPGPPADLGATDFTLEFWMKAHAGDNPAAPVECGNNVNWIFGNILIDRDRYNQDRKFGLSIAGGQLVWGISGQGTGDFTLCSVINVLDEQWHHVALQRRRTDGWLWMYVDGVLQSEADGPDGDLSYPDNASPGDYCGGSCVNSDPFLVIGAEKHDAGSAYPSYKGWFDELRLSNVLRYSGSFELSPAPYATDANTLALFHFDEGPQGPCIGIVLDGSGAAGGPSHGLCHHGGAEPSGPLYTADTPIANDEATPIATPAPAAIATQVSATPLLAAPTARAYPPKHARQPTMVKRAGQTNPV